MKAVVYKAPYTVAVEDVDDPTIQDPTDVIFYLNFSESVGNIRNWQGLTVNGEL